MRDSLFTIHHSPFIIHHSSFTILMNPFELHAAKQRIKNMAFRIIAIVGLLFAVSVLLLLLVNVIKDGLGRINIQFITSFPSRRAENAGIVAGLLGSLYMVILTALIAVPIGIGAAI